MSVKLDTYILIHQRSGTACGCIFSTFQQNLEYAVCFGLSVYVLECLGKGVRLESESEAWQGGWCQLVLERGAEGRVKNRRTKKKTRGEQISEKLDVKGKKCNPFICTICGHFPKLIDT